MDDDPPGAGVEIAALIDEREHHGVVAGPPVQMFRVGQGGVSGEERLL
jgi:hypothetical protein